jgi:serine protease inhibitor
LAKCLLALMTFLATGIANTPPPDSRDIGHSLAAPYAQFGFDVLRDLWSEHPGDNVFISPTSIAVALAMASNGAKGATRDAILKTLNSHPQSIDAFNADNRALVEEINKATAVQLSMANALWAQKAFPINPSFSQTLENAYSAQAENLDFRDPNSVDTINAWVAKHTNGRIQEILERVDPSTVAILTNAIAFKGKWSLPFDPKMTGTHDFKNSRDSLRKVPMMKHSGEYLYAKDNSLESIRLPYADGTFAMYVVLPSDAKAMHLFLQALTSDRLTSLVSSLQRRSGTIELPRFTIRYRTSLNATLAKLGMGIAFERGADFSGIHQPPPPMRISDVRHASFLKVDEEGTEAAAATSVGVTAALARRPSEEPFHMVVNHPFFVVIRDERSGQILFTGVVTDPQS